MQQGGEGHPGPQHSSSAPCHPIHPLSKRSRATTTFVGWLVACTGNFLLMLTAFHLPESATAGGGKKAAAGGATDVSAVATA